MNTIYISSPENVIEFLTLNEIKTADELNTAVRNICRNWKSAAQALAEREFYDDLLVVLIELDSKRVERFEVEGNRIVAAV